VGVTLLIVIVGLLIIEWGWEGGVAEPLISTTEYDRPLYIATVCNGRHNSIMRGVTNKLLVPNRLMELKETVQCWMDGGIDRFRLCIPQILMFKIYRKSIYHIW
jgi:hypothetical protein